MALVSNDRFALCVLVLLGLTGCSGGGGDPPIICDVAPSPAPVASQQGLIKVGQQFTMSVFPLSSAGCGGDSNLPASVTAEIEGPGGERVEGQIQLGAGSAPATLQFTPVRAGPHHILVAFSQVGGIHQFDLHAVVDSSTTAPTFTLKQACDSLERTLKGTWVCNTEVIRGETVVRAFTGSRLAVAGDVIWVASPTGVQRYVDMGTDLVMAGSLSHSAGAASFLLASPDELTVVHHNSLALYTFSGGTLGSAGTTPWSRPGAPVGSPEPYGVALRDGAHLAVVTREAPNFQPVVQVCPYQLVSGRFQRITGTCFQLAGDTVGFEPNVLWTKDPPRMIGGRVDQGILHRWEWLGGRLVEQGSVSLGSHIHLIFPSLMNPSNVPMVYSGATGASGTWLTALATWYPERQATLFEHLDAEELVARASPTFYWGRKVQTASGEITKVRLRPRAPIP